MKRISLLLIFISFQVLSMAQELDFNVKVVASTALDKTDPRIFRALESSIEEFFNNNKWTNDDYEEEERIKGNLQLTIISDPTTTSFTADLLIQSLRPVFGSDYTTTLLNFKESSIPFNYVELQPLEMNVNDFKDNLSSVLLYYIHYILGMDYDSFSPLGGERYFQICQNIASSIPTSVNDRGWNITVDISRAKMIETLLSPRSRKVREASYYYHRLGLDEAGNDIGKSKATLLSALKEVQSVNAAAPNSLTVQMFMDSKRKELVDIFLQSDRGQISQVYDILVEIDPSHSDLFNQLRAR